MRPGDFYKYAFGPDLARRLIRHKDRIRQIVKLPRHPTTIRWAKAGDYSVSGMGKPFSQNSGREFWLGPGVADDVLSKLPEGTHHGKAYAVATPKPAVTPARSELAGKGGPFKHPYHKALEEVSPVPGGMHPEHFGGVGFVPTIKQGPLPITAQRLSAGDTRLPWGTIEGTGIRFPEHMASQDIFKVLDQLGLQSKSFKPLSPGNKEIRALIRKGSL